MPSNHQIFFFLSLFSSVAKKKKENSRDLKLTTTAICRRGRERTYIGNKREELCILEEDGHLIQIEAGLLGQVVAKGFYHQRCHGSLPAYSGLRRIDTFKLS
jgi:hypothetical protein